MHSPVGVYRQLINPHASSAATMRRYTPLSGTSSSNLCFKDLNENKPTTSIKLRVETIDYFLKCSLDTVRSGKQVMRSELGRSRYAR